MKQSKFMKKPKLDIHNERSVKIVINNDIYETARISKLVPQT